MRGGRPRVISIIGMGKGWELAPMLGESWGACNILLRRKVNRIIDMNDYSNDRWGESETKQNQEVMKLCEAMDIPYIGLHNYPIEAIKNYFKTDYFGNTIDYMIALAIYDHCHELNFYGVNMVLKSEYEFEIPSVNFWVGEARGRGIKVRVFGKESMIMRTHDGLIYGYGTPQESLEER